MRVYPYTKEEVAAYPIAIGIVGLCCLAFATIGVLFPMEGCTAIIGKARCYNGTVYLAILTFAVTCVGSVLVFISGLFIHPDKRK